MSARSLLDRLDAALASCTVKLWSELLSALALAGQSAPGVWCFLLDTSGADERPIDCDRHLQVGERATSLDLHADATPSPRPIFR